MKILNQIIAYKREELDALKKLKSLEAIKQEAENLITSGLRNFKGVFANGETKLIAEIKLSSPSHGNLTNLSHLDLAKIYAQSPADAISVLTEKKYFNGDLTFIKEIKAIVSQPILRKDFIFDEYQIYETYIAKADAFLLIASVLTEDKLRDLIALGRSLGLGTLVEVHNEQDLSKALVAGAEIIGINNRDLTTMKIDLATTERLVPLIPGDKIIISESGINSKEDVQKLKVMGVHGILVGTAIVKQKDPLEKIKKLKLL